MEINNLESPTAEELDKHFSALTDSVNLINALVEENDKSDKNKNSVKRNYEHIEIMLTKEFITNDSRDKSMYVNAVNSAKLFVGE
jgi:hypothetical protein